MIFISNQILIYGELKLMPSEEYRAYLESDKWKQIAAQRFKIDGYRCCACGSRGTPSNPLEIHHLSYAHLYHEEDRIYEDLCTLCHCDHKAVHRMMERITSPDGRRGWQNSPRIPQTHVFTYAGADINYIYGGK